MAKKRITNVNETHISVTVTAKERLQALADENKRTLRATLDIMLDEAEKAKK